MSDLADLIKGHEPQWFTDLGMARWDGCTCDPELSQDDWPIHVATAIFLDWLAEHDRRVRAETLREAADRLRGFAWHRFDSRGAYDDRGSALRQAAHEIESEAGPGGAAHPCPRHGGSTDCCCRCYTGPCCLDADR